MKSLTALAPALAILASGCGATDPLDGFPVAWMVTSCSPVDGPAVVLFLAQETPDEVSNPSGPHLAIAIDRSAESLRGNRFTLEDDPPSIFSARQCVDADHCSDLTSAAVVFDRSSSATHGYTGQLDVILPDGSMLEGGFSASLYELLILCG